MAGVPNDDPGCWNGQKCRCARLHGTCFLGGIVWVRAMYAAELYRCLCSGCEWVLHGVPKVVAQGGNHAGTLQWGWDINAG
jgi:hypothetical protein